MMVLTTDASYLDQQPKLQIESSEQVGDLMAALAAAQAAFPIVAKDAANPYFKSKYAPLEAIIDAVRQPLAKVGVVFLQFPSCNGQEVELITRIAKGEQWIQSHLTLVARDVTAQATGSAITYARRYALQSILGIGCADEDDDAEAAMGRTGEAKKPEPAKSTRKVAKPKQKGPDELVLAELKKFKLDSYALMIVRERTGKQLADLTKKEAEEFIATIPRLAQKSGEFRGHVLANNIPMEKAKEWCGGKHFCARDDEFMETLIAAARDYKEPGEEGANEEHLDAVAGEK